MRRLLLAALVTASLAGCTGARYASAPPLPFASVSYGQPTRYATASPRIAYTDTGTGEETIVLVHGLASNAGFWRYVVPTLAQQYRVIAVDLPGFGKSDKGQHLDYSMAGQAEAVARLVDALGVGPVHLVGHSMGGQIGTTLALRHPERLRSLTLLAPAGIETFRPGEGAWLRNALTVRGIREASEEAVRRNLSQNVYRWSDRYEWLVEERVRMAKSPEMNDFARAVLASVGAMLDQPAAPLLERVRVPTQIVYGKYDGLIPNPYLHPGRARDVFAEGARRIPGARLVEIDEAGHLVQIEKPAEVAAAVLTFVSTH